MAAKKWTAFPHDASAFSYAGPALKKAWAGLHGGDCAAYPDAKWIAAEIADSASLKKILKGDAKAIAAELENGWRASKRQPSLARHWALLVPRLPLRPAESMPQLCAMTTRKKWRSIKRALSAAKLRN
jgi:hypothetical protein